MLQTDEIRTALMEAGYQPEAADGIITRDRNRLTAMQSVDSAVADVLNRYAFDGRPDAVDSGERGPSQAARAYVAAGIADRERRRQAAERGLA